MTMPYQTPHRCEFDPNTRKEYVKIGPNILGYEVTSHMVRGECTICGGKFVRLLQGEYDEKTTEE